MVCVVYRGEPIAGIINQVSCQGTAQLYCTIKLLVAPILLVPVGVIDSGVETIAVVAAHAEVVVGVAGGTCTFVCVWCTGYWSRCVAALIGLGSHTCCGLVWFP